MSAYKAVRLVCDEAGCRRTKVIRVISTASGIHEARERAARAGWTSPERPGWTADAAAAVDRCPVHSA